MLEIIFIVLPVFVVILTGNVLMKLGLFNSEFVEASNRLIFYVFLPLLMFYNIAVSDFKQVFSLSNLIIMGAAILMVFAGSFLAAKLFKLPDKMRGTFTMNSFQGNLAYIGLPVCYFAFGEHGLAVASILMGFTSPLINILAVFSLVLGNLKDFSVRVLLKETIGNAIVIACFIGIIFSAAEIPLPVFIDRSLEIITGISLPLALLCIGATINFYHLRGGITAIGLSAVMKLVIMPMLGLLGVYALGLTLGINEQAMIIMLACPTAAASYIFASTMNGDPDLASGTIVATTMMSIITFVIWLHLLGTA
ncbi:MAG: AEC family transporter [Syntrophomonadaceae bacterium]|nr:AEC family transporter [Syntrophomonadaceae bacterium]